MDVKNDLSGGKPTLLIAEDEESIILCNIQGIMENGMTLCAITDITDRVLHGLLRSIVGSIIWSR